MKNRRLLNLLTALSLLLCAAVVARWVKDWTRSGPGGEPSGWGGALEVKAPTARDVDESTQVGDLVRFAVEDVEGPGMVLRRQQRIGRDGNLRLPYVGPTNVIGLNAHQIRSSLKDAYAQPHDIYYDRRYTADILTGDRRLPYRILTLAFGALPAIRSVLSFPSLFYRRRQSLAASQPVAQYTCEAASDAPAASADPTLNPTVTT